MTPLQSLHHTAKLITEYSPTVYWVAQSLPIHCMNGKVAMRQVERSSTSSIVLLGCMHIPAIKKSRYRHVMTDSYNIAFNINHNRHNSPSNWASITNCVATEEEGADGQQVWSSRWCWDLPTLRRIWSYHFGAGIKSCPCWCILGFL